MTTHYIPAFTRENGRQREAACGAWVRRAEHSCEPSCPTCKAYLESETADTRTAEEVFGDDSATH